jgi:hypothetical protein
MAGWIPASLDCTSVVRNSAHFSEVDKSWWMVFSSCRDRCVKVSFGTVLQFHSATGQHSLNKFSNITLPSAVGGIAGLCQHMQAVHSIQTTSVALSSNRTRPLTYGEQLDVRRGLCEERRVQKRSKMYPVCSSTHFPQHVRWM